MQLVPNYAGYVYKCQGTRTWTCDMYCLLSANTIRLLTCRTVYQWGMFDIESSVTLVKQNEALQEVKRKEDGTLPAVDGKRKHVVVWKQDHHVSKTVSSRHSGQVSHAVKSAD